MTHKPEKLRDVDEAMDQKTDYTMVFRVSFVVAVYPFPPFCCRPQAVPGFDSTDSALAFVRSRASHSVETDILPAKNRNRAPSPGAWDSGYNVCSKLHESNQDATSRRLSETLCAISGTLSGHRERLSPHHHDGSSTEGNESDFLH